MAERVNSCLSRQCGRADKREKCNDEESRRLRNVSASRRGCETGASRETLKITSEQSGQKEREILKYR